MTLCFVDCETTGLDPDRHEPWEVAVILRGRVPDALTRELLEHLAKPVEHPDEAASWIPAVLLEHPGDEMFVWQLPVDLARADPIALNIGGFVERRWPPAARADDLPAPFNRHSLPEVPPTPKVVHPARLGGWCRAFAKLTWGAHMVGMVPSFDTERLGRLLRANGACPGWHYQPIDVETLVVGCLHGRNEMLTDLQPPWDSEALSRLAGVDPDKYPRHSAMGDACWARDVWDAVQPKWAEAGQ